jgi:hypothetical protein
MMIKIDNTAELCSTAQKKYKLLEGLLGHPPTFIELNMTDEQIEKLKQKRAFEATYHVCK